MERLRELQALPLERKVGFTVARITEFYDHFNGQVCVNFSGGKDSTVLLYIARKLYPEIKAIYVDTGLEFPEIREFVATFDNIDWIRPEKSFKRVIEEEGYPVISKEVAQAIREKREGMPYAIRRWADCDRIEKCEIPAPYWYKIIGRWRHLENAPFKISERCCDEMKKKPIMAYQRRTGFKPIIGTMASESKMRTAAWLKTGCNAFEGRHQQSKPLSFWTEQDILEYIKRMGIGIAKCYGEIIKDKDGKWRTTGESRTGCMFCLFGCHRQRQPNKIQRLAQTHPTVYRYILDKLGFRDVMDFLKIPYQTTSNTEENTNE